MSCRLGHALVERVRHVDGAGADQKRLAPRAAERRDIGGEGHHGGRECRAASPAAAAGISITSRSFGFARDGARRWRPW